MVANRSSSNLSDGSRFEVVEVNANLQRIESSINQWKQKMEENLKNFIASANIEKKTELSQKEERAKANEWSENEGINGTTEKDNTREQHF